MNVAFVDTSFYQAILNPRDQWHRAAVEFSTDFRENTVTSEYVLCELGALMSSQHVRRLFVGFVEILQTTAQVEVMPASPEYFRAGLDLFAGRPDKAWSLIDCISFEQMRSRGIADALSFDRHFEQAGFRLLPGT